MTVDVTTSEWGLRVLKKWALDGIHILGPGPEGRKAHQKLDRRWPPQNELPSSLELDRQLEVFADENVGS